jgi:hypothetical protein
MFDTITREIHSNGARIRKRILEINSLPDSAALTIAHGLNLTKVKVVDLRGLAIGLGPSYVAIPNGGGVSLNAMSLSMDEDEVNVTTTSDMGSYGFGAEITIYYV